MRKNTLLISFLAIATAVFPIQTEGKKSESYSSKENRTQEKSKKKKVRIRETRKTKEQPIKIIGDEEFIQRTQEALTLIKEKSPRSYAIVTNYLSVIRRGEQSGIQASAEPPTYYVGLRTAESELTWYASCIVHDATHSKLYRDYRKKHKRERVPDEIYRGRSGENACISVQQDFYRDVGGFEKKIQYLEKLKTIDYFSAKTRDW